MSFYIFINLEKKMHNIVWDVTTRFSMVSKIAISGSHSVN